MRRLVIMALIVGGIAWYRGWWPQVVNVPALVTERAGCDPSYPTVCIPPPPPYLECDQIRPGGFKVFGRDPHNLDPDRDGFGC